MLCSLSMYITGKLFFTLILAVYAVCQWQNTLWLCGHAQIWKLHQGGNSILRCRLTSKGNPIVEILRSQDRLISTMGFPILVRWHLYIESGPSLLWCRDAHSDWIHSERPNGVSKCLLLTGIEHSERPSGVSKCLLLTVIEHIVKDLVELLNVCCSQGLNT